MTDVDSLKKNLDYSVPSEEFEQANSPQHFKRKLVDQGNYRIIE